ncbi:hypothetical protein [Mucilaginibacter ginkgonis]|uniref:Uncharacterized protein n=1 Tax=Mucilaginibacter ginkgonis TaxID=2682091 RepID=A0A6I4I3C6_9SPHI|nr:hypothetical protein [Mucilaginibacter ginkgonis]QQL49801.1 hypothetical protein GO620_016795 [Mucilaginibacter ginkgonis]
MKLRPSFFFILLISVGLEAISQTSVQHKLPPDWTVEKFNLPPSFAPGFPYTGTEEAFFSPDWANNKSRLYWTYCFKWSLTGYPSLDKSGLENALKIYYTNLLISNLRLANIDPAYSIPVTVKLIDLKSNDIAYQGTVTMLDYMTQKPIVLHIRVIKKEPKTIFVEASPLPVADKVWATMDAIYN